MCHCVKVAGPTVDNRLRRSRDKTGTREGGPRYTHCVVRGKPRGGQSSHRISFNHAKGTREIKARTTVGSPVKGCWMSKSGNMSCRTIRNCPDWPTDWPTSPTSPLECGDTSFCPANTKLSARPLWIGRHPLPRTRPCLSHGPVVRHGERYISGPGATGSPDNVLATSWTSQFAPNRSEGIADAPLHPIVFLAIGAISPGYGFSAVRGPLLIKTDRAI